MPESLQWFADLLLVVVAWHFVPYFLKSKEPEPIAPTQPPTTPRSHRFAVPISPGKARTNSCFAGQTCSNNSVDPLPYSDLPPHTRADT